MTIVRGEAIGATVYEYFPFYPSVANGVVQLLCGVVLGVVSLPNLLNRQVCDDRCTPYVDIGVIAGVWVYE
jgi:hypothetical protein